jgi:C-terminal processing protease CtpA/Prc
MKTVFAIVTLALVTIPCAAPAQEFDRQGWLSDYAVLKQTLERRYSNLAWFASPEGGVDLPAVDKHTLAQLQAATTDDDARAALVGFVRAFHDGHFSQLGGDNPIGGGRPAQRAPAPTSPTFTRGDAATGCAAFGFVQSGPPQFSLPFEELAGFRLATDGIDTPFRSGVLEGGEGHARIGIVRIPVFEEEKTFAACVAVWNRSDLWTTEGTLDRDRLHDAVIASWYRAMADILQRFQRDSVAAVAVDVGNNSGGDDSGDIITRLFTTRALRSSTMLISQDSAAATAYFQEQIEALTDARKRDSSSALVQETLRAFVTRRDSLDAARCPLHWVWTERRSWTSTGCKRLVPVGTSGGPIAYLAPNAVRDTAVAHELSWSTQVAPLWGSWSGRLYVITDGRTYSSAEMFTAVLRNNEAARTIGATTGGDGCGFIDSNGQVLLPHSRLRFRVPNCVRLRADGTDEVAGVSPDIPVLTTPGENPRARALRMMQALTSELKG